MDPKERVVMLSLMRKAAYEGILAAEVDLERLTLSEWRDDTQRAPRGMGVLFAGTREELKREMSRQFVEGSVIAFYPRKLAWLIVILDLFAEFGGALDQVVQPLVGAIDSGEESGKENVRRYLREYIIQPGNLSALRAKLRILHKIISRSAKPHYFLNKKIKIFLGEDKFFSRGLALGYAGRFSEINSVYLHINHIRDCQGFRHLFEHEVWHHSPDGQQANKIVHAWQSEEEKAEVMAYGWGLLLENISAELVDPTEPLVLEALRTLGLSGIDVSL